MVDYLNLNPVGRASSTVKRTGTPTIRTNRQQLSLSQPYLVNGNIGNNNNINNNINNNNNNNCNTGNNINNNSNNNNNNSGNNNSDIDNHPHYEPRTPTSHSAPKNVFFNYLPQNNFTNFLSTNLNRLSNSAANIINSNLNSMDQSQINSSLPLQTASSISNATDSDSSNVNVNSNTNSTPSLSTKYCYLSPEQVAHDLKTSLQHGLDSNQDALYRRSISGANELEADEDDPIYLKFAKQFYENPLIILLLISAAVSFFMGSYDDAASITIAISIVTTVGFVQEYRSEQSLKALNQLVPYQTHLIRGNNSSTVLASHLVPGDLVSFDVGDRIPADVRIVKAVHLEIDESNLTGEAKPVKKFVTALPKPNNTNNNANNISPFEQSNPYASSSQSESSVKNVPISERSCIAFMGTLVREGHGLGIVIATGKETELGQVFNMVSEIDKPKTPLQRNMDLLGKQLSFASFIIIGIICLIGILQGRGPLEMFTIGVSLAVAAIPEGLPIIVTVTLALGVLRMAKHKAIVRRLPSVETLGCVNVICSDKTGTLTVNHMTVTNIWTFGAKSVVDISDRSNLKKNNISNSNIDSFYDSSPSNSLDIQETHTSSSSASIPLTPMPISSNSSSSFFTSASIDTHEFQKLPQAPLRNLLTVAELCNNSKISSQSPGEFLGNPTDVAISECAHLYGLYDLRNMNTRINEVPFSSSRKYMVVVTKRNIHVPHPVSSASASTLNIAGHNSASNGTSSSRFSASSLTNSNSQRNSVSEDPLASSYRFGHRNLEGNSDDAALPTVQIKGAYEKILPKCEYYINGDGKSIPFDENARETIKKRVLEMSNNGLRIIAVASGVVPKNHILLGSNASSFTEENISNQDYTSMADRTTNSTNKQDEIFQGLQLTFNGLIGMYDPPRKGVMHAIKELVYGKVKVVMITGDSGPTAYNIAKKIGLPLYGDERTSVLSGEDVEQMSESDLIKAVGNVTVFCRTTPEHKMKIIRAFQARGDVVAMTGDGVNDAPALKMADIGIAMGKRGTDVAKESGDMILTDDDFCTILNAIEEGKGIFCNIRNFITFQLSTSIAALTLVAVSTIFGLPNPLNAMQILWINILMDGPPAQSLGVEPVDPSIMSQPPRARDDEIITFRLLYRTLRTATVILIGTLSVYVYEMQADRKVTARDTTMTFTCFVLFDMFSALSCRSDSKSVFSIGMFSNKMFNIAVSLSLLCQLCVIYVPFLQSVFDTEPISLGDIVFLIALSSTVLVVDEIAKYVEQKSDIGIGGYSTRV